MLTAYGVVTISKNWQQRHQRRERNVTATLQQAAINIFLVCFCAAWLRAAGELQWRAQKSSSAAKIWRRQVAGVAYA